MPYFDAASAAPLHPAAAQALQAALAEGWADPARLHREGRRARLLLDAARASAAESVGCRPDELTFTPSGTRAVHTAVAGALAGRRRAGRRLVVSAVEHSSVLHSAERHEAAGGTVAEVPVDRTGAVSAEAFAAALAPGTALACLQSANHEVGTVQPVAEAAAACRAAGVPLLVDAAQSLLWDPVPGAWSLLAASAHKWGGPAGVGLLVVRKGTRFAPQEPGDERESGRAPGFENVPAVVAAAAALGAARREAQAQAARLRELTDLVRARVPQLVPDVEVVGDPARRLPHLVTFSCLYVDGEALLQELDRAGFSLSSGSSCTSSTLTPSHVLRAMGVLSEGNVRMSLPLGTDAADVERFLEVLPGAVRRVREQVGGAARGAGASVEPSVTNPSGPNKHVEGAAHGAGASAGGANGGGPGGSGAPGAGHDAETEHGPGADRVPGADADGADADGVSGADADGVSGAGTDGVSGAGLVVDAVGRLCPVPVIELARVIGRVPVGGTVTVLADDEAARLDIPAWCTMRGQEYVGEEPADRVRATAYTVRRTS